MTRAEALAAATTYVDGVAPRNNARGYSDGCLTPVQRIEQVLRVADWLLDGDQPDTTIVSTWDGGTVREIDRPTFNHPNTGAPLGEG